jgi:alanine racemase
MSRPTYAEVDLEAIRQNLRALKVLMGPGVKVLGVIKADGYGHGMVPVGQALEEAGADMLGVALVEEGIELRVAGITLPILVMNILPANEVGAAMEYSLQTMIDDLRTAREIEDQAGRRQTVIQVHLKIDTGMNRLGIRSEEVASAAESLRGMKHLALAGAYTHLACADDENDEVTRQQLARFDEALRGLRAAGFQPPLLHLANSSASIAQPAARFNLVRSGLALYGIRPCRAAAKVNLRPALALKSHVAHLKRVHRGEGVGYGHTWRAQRESILGVLPIGYADGYPRSLSNRGQARVAGRLVPVIGTVCMDAMMVDLTDIESPRVGQVATLIEASHESPLSVEAVARLCGTIPYEILTGLSRRIPRLYR